MTESCVDNKHTPFYTGSVFFNNKHPTVAIEQQLIANTARDANLVTTPHTILARSTYG